MKSDDELTAVSLSLYGKTSLSCWQDNAMLHHEIHF